MSDFNIENGVLKKYTGSDSNVVIPDGVTEIGVQAFEDCRRLKSVTIPGSVKKIGGGAFYGCSSLTSVTIPDSVTEIGERAFHSCDKLSKAHISNLAKWCGIKFVNWSSNPLDYAHNLYLNGEHVTDLVIPDGVAKICDRAFSGCRSLTSVTIPDSVTKIGTLAFSSCDKLSEVHISDLAKWCDIKFDGLESNPLEYAHNLYLNGERVTDLVIPDGVTKICYSAFSGCSSFTSVTIPDSVTKICDRALYDCRRLKSMTIPDGVTEIGEGAFYSCSGLTSITIPDSVTKIGDCAFYGCRRLKSVTIPDGVTEIGDWVFSGCSGLTSVMIPDSVTKIGESAFSGCDKLAEVHISDLAKWCDIKFGGYCSNPLEYAHNLYLNGEHVTDLVIPKGVTEIGGYAFSGCTGLTSVTIPDSVTKIGDNAFSGCKRLKTVVLPAGKDLLWFAEETGNCYPLCYTATEEQMANAIKEAAKWIKNKKEAFYEAYLVSDTRAAMLLAEKRKELDKYAKMRGMTADEVRDSMLSDLGLDAEGCKAYDLGNITVNVRMLSDFTFTVELPDGKASKSIPKKGADEKKYEEANKDFSEIKKNVKKIWKNRSDVILSDFITGKEREASYWIKTYSGNPVLRHIACLIVWEQNGAYFTKTKDGTVDAEGAPYELGEGTVRVAHPMEMSAEEVSAWQKYFTDRVLKQPFAQIWERVYKPEDISEDRYKDCPILFFALQGAGKHGFDEKLKISGCKVETKWTSEKAPNGNSVSCCNITSFRIGKYSRAVNHAIAYLDRTTVLGRIAKDDISVMDYVEGCNAAQITDYTDAANNAKATNVLAALLEYKNKNFPDATPFDMFTLDW